MSDLDEAYQLDYFEEEGFHRQECASCGDMFWSRVERETCGERRVRSTTSSTTPGSTSPTR